MPATKGMALIHIYYNRKLPKNSEEGIKIIFGIFLNCLKNKNLKKSKI